MRTLQAFFIRPQCIEIAVDCCLIVVPHALHLEPALTVCRRTVVEGWPVDKVMHV